ncbi:MAG: DUF488 domain-containing protein [Armatimonadota bacterium]|nr:DUF488 domain-containing protein [Armatimonadota bacterium]
MSLFTIGHSNHDIQRFIELLREHRIDVVVDVRSTPYSRYVPQYSMDNLRGTLEEHNIQYLYLGKELGGHPDVPSLYDEKGYALYDRFVTTDFFQKGIARLLRVLSSGVRVVLLCSEENPNECHRRLLITWYLYHQMHVDAIHIRGDGTIQRESVLHADASSSLFGDDPALAAPPRSAKPVRNTQKQNPGEVPDEL